MARLLVIVAVLALTSAFGWWYRTRQGRASTVDGTRVDLPTLGVTPGRLVTLVQLSSSTCAPCRATARVWTDLTRGLDGVTHVELDAAEHLDLVRALQVLRTPTTFVLGSDGTVRLRLSGAVDRSQAQAALDTVTTTGGHR